ncbi:MAG: DUF4276 family protein [Candidatus Eisenbacteria bacterium]
MKLYVEGGGNSKAMQRECARGFRKFAERAGIAPMLLTIVACGGRHDAYERFSLSHTADVQLALLLVDSEAPVSAPATAAEPWAQLGDEWSQPTNATDDQCHLMVQVMESWLLADRETLSSYYGRGFLPNRLPGNPRVEDIPKADVLAGLAGATRNTQKGTYAKGSHAFEILASLDPSTVEGAAPYAKRLLDVLRRHATRREP